MDRLRNDLDATYFQLTTIDLEGVLHRPANNESHWPPIAPDDRANLPFTGSYDGQSLPIRNLRIHLPEQNYIGLFGYTNNSTLQNIVLQGVYVRGNNKVGGLVGDNLGANISSSYARGKVSGSGSNVGGLVGDNSAGTISASYWDNTIEDSTSEHGEGKSTDAMRTQSSYIGWDFDSIWGIDENSDTDPKQRINYGYPYLLCVGGQAGYSFQTRSDCDAEQQP